MKSLYLAVLLIFLTCGAFAQSFTLRGRIVDTQGQPVPFASIYERNTTRGTAANGEGEYTLSLPAGKYQISYRAIGYTPESKSIDLASNLNIDVTLNPAAYSLSDVVVKAEGEDPAYAVIRNAIRRRKTHLTEVRSYAVDVYIKGMQKLLAAPQKFLGRDISGLGREIGLDSNRTGILYLSESSSILNFLAPDKYREEMVASKVAGSNRAFSFNRATDMRIDFYENFLSLDGLNNRPLISPISDNAFFYYDYTLIGTTIENGLLINKIRLIPKRQSDPVFRGEIYIIEDSWRLHSADVHLTKATGINFVDTLNIRQEFIPVSGRVWMPASLRYDFKGGVLGFKFGGYYLALYKNYDLKPQLSAKDFKEELRINAGVNKKDTTYWSQARPVPLTGEEATDYVKKESLAAKRESRAYLDSLDKVHNKVKIVPMLIGKGYTHRERYRRESYHFSSLGNALFYNTVEGFGINYQASFTKQLDSVANRYVNFTGKIRYGLASDQLHATFGTTIPLKNATITFNFGSDVIDLNNQNTITPLGNSINSLLYERNFLKLYQKRFVNLTGTYNFGAVSASLGAEWAARKALMNLSDYTINDFPNRSFSSNNPLNRSSDLPFFAPNDAVKIIARLSSDFSNRYATYPTGKVHRPSGYPTLGITFVQGVPYLLGSDVNYTLLSADLSKSDISLGMYGKSRFWIGAGKFLNNRKIYYMDYKHFSGNRSLTYTPRATSFLFLEFYQHSTASEYLEGHFEHNFSGFILNKIPLVRKLKLTEVAGVNYLHTGAARNYTEFYFGLEYLTLRAVYGYSWTEGKLIDRGIRIAYGF